MAIEGDEEYARMPYCGILETILEVDYGLFKVILLGAKWYKVILSGRNSTIRYDDCGFIRVNTEHVRHSHRIDSDVWIYPNQVDQCFYVPLRGVDAAWSIVVPVFPRSRRHPQKLVEVEDQEQV
jgi:hypothetical protein